VTASLHVALQLGPQAGSERTLCPDARRDGWRADLRLREARRAVGSLQINESQVGGKVLVEMLGQGDEHRRGGREPDELVERRLTGTTVTGNRRSAA
jgi:hypothetical protein